jgi:hypothetical protein
MLLSSCGLPGSGSARVVDDDTVPTRLLDRHSPSSGSTATIGVPERVPVVFWLVDEDRLTPTAAQASCAEPADVVVGRLLGALAAGPTDEARAAGRSTAIPPESVPQLVEIRAGTAVVEVDPETPISADRLPFAVGQIVLSVTSAPGVSSVSLVNDDAPVQQPLPGGALTDEPVSADDYAALVPERYDETGEVGCSVS